MPTPLARDFSKVRADFPILDTDLDGRRPVYLDNAATTHKPRQVLDAIIEYYTTANSNVGRSVHTLSMRSSDKYESSRARVAAFIGAETHEIVFTRGTTDSINMVAEGFGRQVVTAGDEVLISGMEHHSNLLPWMRLCERTGATLSVVPIDKNGEVSAAAFIERMTERTRLIAVAHVSNVQGTVNPVREITAEARRHGIRVAVDGAQAVAHRPVDVRDLDADFYCFSSHKMYGPMGVGVMYAKGECLERMQPVNVGGGIVRGVSYEQTNDYLPPPHLLESGTPNIAGAVGLAAAIDYLDGLDRALVADHDFALASRAAEGLRALDRVHVFGAQQPRGGLVSFAVEGLHPYDVGNHLNRFGIATRTGVHCAIPFIDSLGLEIGSTRASFAVYNTLDEVEQLIEAVDSVEKGFWTTEHPHERFLVS
jgi:cysteine desulfurase/selenocysteine lyase